MLEVLLIILITSITTILSLSGGFLLLSGSKLARKFQKYGTIFAAVVLLYAVFGDIVPEVLEEGSLPVWQVAMLLGLGFLICLFIGMVVGKFHKHGNKDEHFKDKKQAYSMLVVDTLHTAMDGIVVGTSFAAGIGTGFIAAIATATHEIPQEVGDFSIMIRSKMAKKKIIKYQVFSALVLVPFALISYFIGDFLGPALPPLLCIVAGFFLYIAIIEICSIIKVIWKKATRAYKEKELK